MAETCTSLHDTPAMPKDKQTVGAIELVRLAQGILSRAEKALWDRGDRYNGSGVTANDDKVLGLESYVERLTENVVRTYVTKDTAQAEDIVGYAALFGAWMVMGCPESQFKPTIDDILARYRRRHDSYPIDLRVKPKGCACVKDRQSAGMGG